MVETYYPEYIPAEANETSEGKILNTIIDEFDNLLEKTDKDYRAKIFFTISPVHYHEFNRSGDYYKIDIKPCESGFNSCDYFINRFEEKESLDKFAEENNIGLITY